MSRKVKIFIFLAKFTSENLVGSWKGCTFAFAALEKATRQSFFERIT